MPAMSDLEAVACRSRAWHAFARRVVLPWAVRGRSLAGDVLEIGAGSAGMAAELLAVNPGARVTATDLDPAMVSKARKTLQPFGARAEVERADATALPFADGSFDAALSFLMLHHVGAWDKALEELARVLRPGGALFVYDLLDTLPARLAHAATRSPGVRLIRESELDAVVSQLSLERRCLDRYGILFRLSAGKPPVDAPRPEIEHNSS